MKLRYKFAIGVMTFLTVSVLSLGVVLSYDSACGPAPSIGTNTELMKAIVYRCYGSPDVLGYEDVEKPTPADNEVLVKVHAAAVNPLDWHYMRGLPYPLRLFAGLGAPTDTSMGVDFAGTVVAVGKNVEQFKPGDEVYGGKGGSLAEYIAVSEDRALVLKPPNMSFEQVAAVPVAGVTALQALRDAGKLEPGQKVLINGASGGVGTFAVQIAKAFGAEVTGVCSTRNVELVRSIGADHVFDYTREDYTKSGQRYDLIIDNVGNRSLLENRKVLTSDGTMVIVGGPKGDWLGPLTILIKVPLLSPFVEQEFVNLLSELSKDDLTTLAELMLAGSVTPVIDRHYRLNEVPAAIRYLEEGHARGKIVINLE